MELFEQLEDRQFLSVSPVVELAQDRGVAELARREPRAVARLAHRPATPDATAARPVGEQRPRNPVAALAGEGGGAAVNELAQSEPAAVAELVRQDDGETGGEGGGGEGGGENDGVAPTNPIAVIAITDGGAAVGELAQSEPGAVAEVVRSDDGEGGGEPAPRVNPVADLATTEGGSTIAEIAGGETGAVADLLK